MRVAAFALPALAALHSAALAQAFDVDGATAISGTWTYRPGAAQSEAAFADSAGAIRLTIRCNRAARTVSIVRTGIPAAAPSLSVWTSTVSRSVPARFTLPGTLTADLAAADPLLDAVALSRGKFATSALGASAAVYPAWAEPARVIEDCRA